MKKLKQRIMHDPENGRYGDCHRTCIASILELEPEEVPHFCEDNCNAQEFWKRQEDWLRERGLGIANIPFPAEGGTTLEDVFISLEVYAFGIPYILGGTSKIGCPHSVVVWGGKIFCDPSGSGIVGPDEDGYWWVSFITVGDKGLRALTGRE